MKLQQIQQTGHAGRPMMTDNNFEVFAWFFMRVSGVVLIFMALGHLAIMHLINHVDQINYTFVANRFATPFWRTYDLVMLILALLHGVNGARTVLEDYVHSKGWRAVSLSTLYVLGFIFLILGSIVILTFQPIKG